MATDDTGVLVSEVRYSAFGEVRYDSGTMTTDYLYTGQREEAEVGLYYYVARWYDPAIGRFVQADSVVPNPGSAVGYDRYGYAFNNPIVYGDPSGHFPVILIPPLVLLLLLTGCSESNSAPPIGSEDHAILTTQMQSASTSEEKQAVVDAVVNTYGIDTSNVNGSVTYDSYLESQGRTYINGSVSIGPEIFDDGHSVGYLALAIEHEVNIHLNSQLYGDRWYHYEGNDQQLNTLVNNDLSFMSEIEAYSYLDERAKDYQLLDWEINDIQQGLKSNQGLLQRTNPYLFNHIKKHGYTLPINEAGGYSVPGYSSDVVVNTYPSPQ